MRLFGQKRKNANYEMSFLSKKAAIYYPLIFISCFAMLDLGRKIVLVVESKPEHILTCENVNKAIVLLLGYYAVTFFTTSSFMFLQQYFYKTEKYYKDNEEGFFVFVVTLFYAICYAGYICFFNGYIVGNVLEVIFSLVFMAIINNAVLESVEESAQSSTSDIGRFSG